MCFVHLECLSGLSEHSSDLRLSELAPSHIQPAPPVAAAAAAAAAAVSKQQGAEVTTTEEEGEGSSTSLTQTSSHSKLKDGKPITSSQPPSFVKPTAPASTVPSPLSKPKEVSSALAPSAPKTKDTTSANSAQTKPKVGTLGQIHDLYKLNAM